MPQIGHYDLSGPENELKKIIDLVAVPSKDRLNSLEQVEENNLQFIGMRSQHSTIESAIKAHDLPLLGLPPGSC